MARYLLEIVVTGNASGQLDQIANGVNRVVQQAGGVARAFKDGKKGIEDVAEAAQSGLFMAFSEKMNDIGLEFANMVGGMRNTAEAFVKEVVSDSATFEDAQAEMRFAFKENWQSIYDQVLKDAADLTFTFEQTSRLASSMGRLNINPFGGVDEKSQLFMSRNGQQIRALQVLQDTADAVGKTADDLVVSIRNALSGSWKSLQDRFDIPKDKIAAWKKEIDGAKDKQAGYNKLVSELALMFGGAGLEKAQNWNKAIAQVPDLLQQLRAGMGAEGLKLMAAAVRDFVSELTGLVKSKDAMGALSEGFKLVAQAISAGIRAGASFVGWVRRVLEVAPWLPKVAAGFTMVAIAVGTVGTLIFGLASSITGLIAVVSAVGAPAIGAFFATMIAAGPLILVLAAALIGMGAAAKSAGDLIFGSWSGGEGVLGLFEKGKLLFTAAFEALSSFNGETSELSLETAEKLKKAGLWETFLKVEKFIYNASKAWESFSDGLDDMTARIGPVLLPLFDELKLLLFELSDAFGVSDAAMKMGDATTADYMDTGKSLAQVIGELGRGVVQVTRFFVAFTRTALAVGRALHDIASTAFKPLIDFMSMLWTITEKVISSLGKLAGMAGLGKGHLNHMKGGIWGADAEGFSKNPLAKIGEKGRGFAGFGADYQGLDPTKKANMLAELSASGAISQKNAQRIAEGKDPIAEAPKGMNLDKYLKMASGDGTATLPVPVADPRGILDVGKDGSGTSKPTDNSKNLSPEVMQAMATAFAVELAKQPKPPISVQIDGKEVARAVQDQKVGSGGRQ